MDLVDRLQNSKMTHPTSPKFDVDRWLSLRADPALTAKDEDIVAIGYEIHNTLGALRKKLNFINDTVSSAAQKRLALVSLANRECLKIECRTYIEALDRTPIGSNLLLDAAASQSLDMAGGAFRGHEVAEGIVDATERLLAMLPFAVGNEIPSAFYIKDDELANDINVALAYLNTEALWGNVVWNGVRRTRRLEREVFAMMAVAEDAFSAAARHRYAMNTVAEHYRSYASGVKSHGVVHRAGWCSFVARFAPSRNFVDICSLSPGPA